MYITRSTIVLFGFLLVSSNAVATLIGDQINATATGFEGAVILDGATATVSATDVEYSVPNFFGGGSLFTIDFSENSFTVFVDLADLGFLTPYTLSISGLDWTDSPGQLESVTQTVFETSANIDGVVSGWLNNIEFGVDYINLTSDSGFFKSGVTFSTTYEFTASHNDNGGDNGNGGVSVPEPTTLALLSLGLGVLGLTRRRIARHR